MTDAKARFAIATLVLALREERLPSKVTDRQTSKEHIPTGSFSQSSFDFKFEDGTRFWGERTTSKVTAHVESNSEKIIIEYSGSSSSVSVSKAEDEIHRIIYSQVSGSGKTVTLSGSAGNFEYFA